MAIMALAANTDKSKMRDKIKCMLPDAHAIWAPWPDSRKDAMIQEFRNDIMTAAQEGDGELLRRTIELRGLEWGLYSEDILDDAVLEESEDSCMHIAARKGDMDLLFIISHGFDNRGHRWPIKTARFLIVKQNAEGDTPLHCAARGGHMDAVVSLFADWTGPWRLSTLKNEYKLWPPELGLWPEEWAIESDLRDIKNKAGRTAMEEAELAGHSDIAYWLVHLMPQPETNGDES